MRIIFILMLFCIVSISVSTPAFAQYDVIYYAVSSGGGEQTDGATYCYTTVGQPAIDISSNASNQAKLGFWHVLVERDFGPISAVMFAAVGADPCDDGVVLHWEIAEAAGLEGFNVYRSTQEGADFVRLNQALLPAGRTTYLDPSAKPGQEYWYVIGAIDRDGESISWAVNIEVPIIETTLFQNYPNPFNPGTTIAFHLAKAERVTITIYDIRGRMVRQLVSGRYPYGKHRTEWNGRNNRNELVGSGVYFYRMKAGKFTQVRKMIFLK